MAPLAGQIHNALAWLEVEACRREEAGKHAAYALEWSERYRDASPEERAIWEGTPEETAETSTEVEPQA